MRFCKNCVFRRSSSGGIEGVAAALEGFSVGHMIELNEVFGVLGQFHSGILLQINALCNGFFVAFAVHIVVFDQLAFGIPYQDAHAGNFSLLRIVDGGIEFGIVFFDEVCLHCAVCGFEFLGRGKRYLAAVKGFCAGLGEKLYGITAAGGQVKFGFCVDVQRLIKSSEV